MSDLKGRIDELADLMREFNLDQGKLEGEGWAIEFDRGEARPGAPLPEVVAAHTESQPSGLAVSSPMMGIFYASPNPASPPFVQEGDLVSANQVLGLIEAMKVFNDIVAPIGGVVKRVCVENGSLVQPGEPIFYIE